MPIFQFKCLKCEALFDEIVSSKDIDKVKCRDCGCPEVDRVVHVIGGYHITGDNSGSTRPKGAGSKKS